MNCANCKEELVELAYGELDPRISQELRTHLESCSSCTLAWRELEAELGLFTAYGQNSEIQPSAGMWTAIQSQIREIEPAPSRPTFWQNLLGSLTVPALIRQTAFAVLLIAASAGLTAYYFTSRRASTDAPISARVPTVDFKPIPEKPKEKEAPAPTPDIDESKPKIVKRPSDDEILDLQVRRAAREYENAIKLLDRSIAKRKSELDPDSIRQYEASLAMVNESIESSRIALREHPQDPLTARFLLSAYSRKVELMQEIAMR